MQRVRLWLSVSMFASIENRTCYGECQSPFEDTILTHGLSCLTCKNLEKYVFLKGLRVPEIWCQRRRRTEDRRDMSHGSRVTFYNLAGNHTLRTSGYSSNCMAKQMLARYSISNCSKPCAAFCRFYTSNAGQNPNQGIIDLLQQCKPFQPIVFNA